MADDIISDEYFEDVNAAAVIADLSHKATKATELQNGRIYAVVDGDEVKLLETPGFADQHRDERADRPFRVSRKVTLLNVDSFVDYLARNTTRGEVELRKLNDKPKDFDQLPSSVGIDYLHGDGSIELWADIDARTVTAILDGIDGWRLHTAALQLRTSREWNEWLKIDGQLLPQVEFAEFIDGHMSTIATPDGAKLLDICQTLQATTTANFKQQSILSNGQRTFKWEETVEARAGQNGELTIPGDLTLVLRPFQGAAGVPILARFRYRQNDKGLRIGVKLVEPDVVLEQAFDLVVTQVQEQVPVHVNRGRP